MALRIYNPQFVAVLCVTLFCVNTKIFQHLAREDICSTLLNLCLCHITGAFLFLFHYLLPWQRFNKTRLSVTSTGRLSSSVGGGEGGDPVAAPQTPLLHAKAEDRPATVEARYSQYSQGSMGMNMTAHVNGPEAEAEVQNQKKDSGHWRSPIFWGGSGVLSILLMFYNWCYVKSTKYVTSSLTTGLFQLNIVFCLMYEAIRDQRFSYTKANQGSVLSENMSLFKGDD